MPPKTTNRSKIASGVAKSKTRVVKTKSKVVKTNTKVTKKSSPNKDPSSTTENNVVPSIDVDHGVGSDDEYEDVPELEELDIDTPHEKHEYKPQHTKEIIFLDPSEYVTSEIMTPSEYSYATSIRAKQIENDGVIFTDTGHLTDPIQIAEKEIADRKCPLSVIRMLTNTIGEKRSINDLVIPNM